MKVLTGALAAALGGCGATEDPARQPGSGQVAVEWMQLIAGRVQAEGLSPPVASRIYAYAGLALYQAAAAGRGDSLALAALTVQGMPTPAEVPAGLDGPCVVAGAADAVAEALLGKPESLSGARALLRQQLGTRTEAGMATTLVEESAAFGARLGADLIAWAGGDGFRATRGLPYQRPVGPGLWEPTSPAALSPTEPYWGTLRPFALRAADACAPPPPPAYGETESAELYKQAMAVYDAGRSLDDERRAIARFWADGAGVTATPGGHWVSLLGQAVQARQLSLLDAATGYARLGVALGDAFISCWHAKYRFNLVRPETYLRQRVDPTWQPLLSTPPFPEYTSGHSVASAAAAVVLSDLLGDSPFTDRTHEARGLPPRSFDSFAAAADEAALSRLYGGIHYPAAIERGLEQGRCVGRAVLERLGTP